MLEAFWQYELCKLLTNWSQLREQCLDVSASFALDKQHCNITPQLYQHGHKVSKLLAMSLYQCSQWRLKVKICENWGQKGKLHVEKNMTEGYWCPNGIAAGLLIPKSGAILWTSCVKPATCRNCCLDMKCVNGLDHCHATHNRKAQILWKSLMYLQ